MPELAAPLTCQHVTICGSPTRDEVLCGEPAHETLCPRHKRWMERLAAMSDTPLDFLLNN